MLCWVAPCTVCDFKRGKESVILCFLVAADGLTCSSVVALMKKLDSYEEELGKMA